MKLIPKLAMASLLCFSAFPVAADDSSSMEQLVQYFQYLGNYLGYDVTQSPTKTNKDYNMSYSLLNMAFAQNSQLYMLSTFIGAITVNSFGDNAYAQFVPNGIPGADMINKLANTTFIGQNYSSQSTQYVSVSPLIDQGASGGGYQTDPVNQSLFNILGTPDYTYCMDIDATTWNTSCSLLYDTKVPANVLGSLPNATTFYTYGYISKFLTQLNSNALIAPLMYSTENPSSSSTSSPQTDSSNPGLVAQNQAQQAANFIRYVSGSVTPLNLPKWKDYDNLYTQTVTKATTNDEVLQQQQAQTTLSNYLASLRTYAAQTSVGLSNLYYILSKRLPQNQPTSDGSANPMSQALSEFNLATWRLFNPNASTAGNTQWVNQINNAAPATVEKEIAILLAEINYQMYLDRQIQERILLTNSIMLLQNTRNTQPSASFSSTPTEGPGESNSQ
jgi:intracellular multiplication protein IcmX